MTDHEELRATCFHEASHAVVFAMGGFNVFAVNAKKARRHHGYCAVGDSVTDSRLSHPCHFPLRYLLYRDKDDCVKVHRDGFNSLATCNKAAPHVMSQCLARCVRASICGLVAGFAAQDIFLGEEPEIDEFLCREMGHDAGLLTDWEKVWALSDLAKPKDIVEKMHALTVEKLKQPDVWSQVESLAALLESRKAIRGKYLATLLPAPIPHWPHSP